jgi:photosystem II stability/assembly factor-like uncharacterized protein
MPALLALLIAAPWAYAQAGPDVAPAAPAPLPVAFGETYVWKLVPGLPPQVRPAGLAVQAGDAAAWLVVDEQGGAWLSEDAGAHWANALEGIGAADAADALPDDERVLLEAEALQDDAELDPADFEVPTTDTTDNTDTTVPEVDTEVLVAPDALDDDARAAADQDAAPPVVWFDPEQPERALLGRADGVWRSNDGGFSWTPVTERAVGEPSVTTFFRMAEGNVLVAGTTAGVLFSLDDGNSWIDVESATGGAGVHQIAEASGVLWAATEAGLYRSPDGLQWERIPIPGATDVRVVVPDPRWNGGFWAAAEGALYRTDDAGASFYIAGRQPLHGLRTMLYPGEPGHLLASSDDGVWESMDGGVSWNIADRQLTDPDVRGVAIADGRPVIATAHGVWRMITPEEDVGFGRTRKLALSLPATVAASIGRDGMNIDLLSLSRRGTVAALAPQLDLYFDWKRAANRDTDLGSEITTDGHDGDWSVGAKMCWGSCGATVVVDYDAAGADIDTGDSSLYAVDGKVFDEGEPVAAAANVAQRIRSYRRSLADTVADAWMARQRLAAEVPQIRNQPLRDQVLHALQIAELNARLDAYTDGAFTRSQTRSEESP